MKKIGLKTARALATALFWALLLAACGGERYNSPTAPAVTSPSPSPSPVELWSVSGRVIGFSDPRGCQFPQTIGAPSKGDWSMYQIGSELMISAGDPVNGDPVYSGSLNGLEFDLRASNFAEGGAESCHAYFDGLLAGRFTDDRRQLDATETWIVRYSSGAEATITVHWTGSRVL